MRHVRAVRPLAGGEALAIACAECREIVGVTDGTFMAFMGYVVLERRDAETGYRRVGLPSREKRGRVGRAHLPESRAAAFRRMGDDFQKLGKALYEERDSAGRQLRSEAAGRIFNNAVVVYCGRCGLAQIADPAGLALR